MSKDKSNVLYEPFMVVKPENERAIRYYRILDDMRDLTGRVLTVIDAAIVDEAQNKSVKDLIKQNFSSFLHKYEDICFYGKQGRSIDL